MTNNTEFDRTARIKVVGVGGGGLQRRVPDVQGAHPGVEYIVVNTDAQALVGSEVPMKLRIGDQLTGARASAAIPTSAGLRRGRAARTCTRRCATRTCCSSRPGWAAGQGTGSAPIVAQIARETGR